MNVMKANTFQKEHMVIAAIRALHGKSRRDMGAVRWVTGREISNQIGYKHPNAIRAMLAELVAVGTFVMTDMGDGKGCCSCTRLYMLATEFRGDGKCL